MTELVELYDSHPGFAGAFVPLPKPMKEIADSLCGQKMTLEEAIEKITPASKLTGGTVGVVEKDKYIFFKFGKKKSYVAYYMLIRYRESSE
jgi:hypothetical protein